MGEERVGADGGVDPEVGTGYGDAWRGRVSSVEWPGRQI